MTITVQADPDYIDDRASAVVNAALTGQRNVTLNQVAAPTSGGLAVTTGSPGNISGNTAYQITFVTATGETELGPASTIAGPVSSQVQLTNIPTGPAGVIARKLYRANINQGEIARYLTTIYDNTTTEFLDNISLASATELPLNINTTGGVVFNGDMPIMVADKATTILGYNTGLTCATENNTFVGANVAPGQTTGYWNTGVGYAAIQDTTTGFENTAVGVNALRGVTTGWYNTAVGVGAGRDCNGSQNVFIGIFAGLKTTGANCVLIGATTGQELTTATGTVGVGHQAGTFIADGVSPNTLNQYGIYIGYRAKASANDTLNEVVIGKDAIGNGNHSITLGPSTNEQVRVFGTIRLTKSTSGGINDFMTLIPDGTTASRGAKQRMLFYGQQPSSDTLFFTGALTCGFDGDGYGNERLTLQSTVSGLLTDTLSLKNARVGIKENNPDYELDVNGKFGFTPGNSVTPVDNGDVVFEFTNNTTFTVRAKGSDGTIRSATLTLA